MITNNLYKNLKLKRSVSGVERVLKDYNYTVLYPSGGNYKIWTNGQHSINVKIEEYGDNESVADYDIYINKIGTDTQVLINLDSVIGL